MGEKLLEAELAVNSTRLDRDGKYSSTPLPGDPALSGSRPRTRSISATGNGSGVSRERQTGTNSPGVVFNTKEGLEKALTQDFNVGGNVSGSAGTTGAAPVTGTSTLLDVYTYVRERGGLFGGVSLQGIKLAIDGSRNAEFYGKPGIEARQILAGQTDSPRVAMTLRQTLNRHAPGR